MIYLYSSPIKGLEEKLLMRRVETKSPKAWLTETEKDKGKKIQKGGAMNGSNFIFGLGIGVLLKTCLDYILSILAEKRELQHKRREASTAIADILSEWIRSAYMGKFSNEDRWQLQKIYWKNIMLLDKKLVGLLGRALAKEPDAPSSNELIMQARKILLKLSKPDISAGQLITWFPNNEKDS